MSVNLAQAILHHGIDNVRFRIPMRRLEFVGFIPGIAFESSDTPTDIVECIVTEKNYKLADNYKIELTPICGDDINKQYGNQKFYISDLEYLIRGRDGKSEYSVLYRDNEFSEFKTVEVCHE